MTMNLEMKKW